VKSKIVPGLEEFLRVYPKMSISPSQDSCLVLSGMFDFSAHSENKPKIVDSYSLCIRVPLNFPETVPEVIETEGKIPRDGKHHVNPNNTLCLGTPLRLQWKLLGNKSLVGFANNCIIPYLYAISHKLIYGGEFIFGELAHGNKGIIVDYLDLFSLKEIIQVKQTLKLLGMKKRIANKKLCPCGCGRRFGICPFHNKVNKFREMASRSWFKARLEDVMGTK